MAFRLEALEGERLRRRLLRLGKKAPLRLKYQCSDCYHLLYALLTRDDLDRLREKPLPIYPISCPACGAMAFRMKEAYTEREWSRSNPYVQGG